MKRYLLAAAFGLTSLALHAQTTATKRTAAPAADLSARLQAVEDRLALKNLVDTFSVLADKKDTQAQTLLFTEDAIVTSSTNGQAGPPLKGRQQIGDTFAAFLKNFSTVYHQNGQQTVTISGDRATGVAYCTVMLVSEQNGQKTGTSMGVVYQDEYRRVNGTWLIAKRLSNFTWRAQQPMQ